MKKSNVSDWHKWFKEGCRNMEDEGSQFSSPSSILGIVHFEFIAQSQAVNYYVEILKVCIEKGLNFGPVIGFSTMTMLQLTRCSLSSSFWPKNQLLK